MRRQEGTSPCGPLKSIAVRSVDKWTDEPGTRFAAALAFYTALTIVPLVVVALMVSATLMNEAIRGGLQQHIGDLIGEPARMDCFS